MGNKEKLNKIKEHSEPRVAVMQTQHRICSDNVPVKRNQDSHISVLHSKIIQKFKVIQKTKLDRLINSYYMFYKC